MGIYTSEVASLLKEKNKVYDWAWKVNHSLALSAEEKELSSVMDEFSKEIVKIGKTGFDSNNIVAEFIRKTVEPQVYNPDDDLLNELFNVGSIDEFDEKHYEKLPKNTIKVYDAVRGGNVPKSYIDPSVITPVSQALQSETEIKYSELRRKGYKSVAKMTELAEQSFNNEKYFRVLQGIDNALVGMENQSFINTGQKVTQPSIQSLTTYLTDNGDNPIMISLNKYAKQIGRMDGANTFLSEKMKNEINKTGILSTYDGVKNIGVSSARKTGLGKLLIPDNRIIGVAGKIGDLDMQGELQVLSTYNNNQEKIELKLTGYDFKYAIYYLEKIARVVFE